MSAEAPAHRFLVAAAQDYADNLSMAIPRRLSGTEDRRQHPLLAWSLSLASHLAMLLAAWVLMAVAWSPPESLPRERKAAIVLRPRTVAASLSSAPDTLPEVGVPAHVAADQLAGFDASSSPASPDLFPPATALPRPPGSSLAMPTLPDVSDELSAGSSVVTTLRPQSGPTSRPKLPFAMIDEAAVLAEDAKIPRKIVPTGPTAALDMFGVAAEGRSFVFVIDRSQSMGGDGLGAIAAVGEQLKSCLASLSADQRIQVVAYNESLAFFPGRKLLPASADNQQALANYVERLAAFGPTEHERGVLAALTIEPEVILLFTDGGDPHLKPGQLASIRARAAETSTSIHVIHFSRDREGTPADSFLRRLASENRGTYVQVRP